VRAIIISIRSLLLFVDCVGSKSLLILHRHGVSMILLMRLHMRNHLLLADRGGSTSNLLPPSYVLVATDA
jgi:hypothetical protein